uniref:Ovule protein n=1 Tax=Heterorhabditis bacteriophora TaxID=37862 RepID=A0A1I7WB17_HETBA
MIKSFFSLSYASRSFFTSILVLYRNEVQKCRLKFLLSLNLKTLRYFGYTQHNLFFFNDISIYCHILFLFD